MKLLVVSGLSGAGKSIALQALEDLDYFCVDNLPVSLLPDFARLIMLRHAKQAIPKVAVGIDARNAEDDLQHFSTVLENTRKLGVECEILFLEASNTVLLKRFSETRRKHPLTKKNVALADAIAVERKLLGPIAVQADLHIDTSRNNVHQLRQQIMDRIVQHGEGLLSVQFMSFGFKYGTPEDADFVYDVRCLPNPHWDPHLRLQTGQDQAVREFLAREPLVTEMLEDINRFLQKWLAEFRRENRSYITIALGCTGGQHRSVYLVERLSETFNNDGVKVLIRHRDLL